VAKRYIQEKLTGQPGQVVSFKSIDGNLEAVVTDLASDPSKSIILTVTAPDDTSRVLVTNGTTTLESNPAYLEFVPSGSDELITSNDNYFYSSEGRIRKFLLPSLGDWVVVATKGGISTQSSINIPSVGSYEITLSYFKAYIDVTYDMGAVCTCSNGIVTLTASDTTGSYRFCVNEEGDWIIQSLSTTTGQAIATVHISSLNEIVVVQLSSIQPNLNDNSWSVIQAVTVEGQAASYWSIGDCKEVILNGTIKNGNTTLKTFSNTTLYVEIIGFDHNAANESNSKSTITFQLGKKDVTRFDRGNSNGTCIGLYNSTGFSMQLTATNAGGWQDSYMRTSLLPQVKLCLPADLQSCMRFVKKYTDNSSTTTHTAAATVTATYDDIFLLSEYEVFATTSASNTNEASAQSRYTYYENGSKVRQRDNSTNTNVWWLRSPSITNTAYYCCVNTSGAIASGSASGSFMISPAFVLGV